MASVSSCLMSKKAKKKNGSKSDRISALPDCLIAEILSLLSTNEAVATSVLSTRWKHLWTLVTNFDFDDEYADSEEACRALVHFVNRVLLFAKQPLFRKFRLRFSPSFCDEENAYINTWLSVALSRGIQHLKLYLGNDVSKERPLPRALFTSTTLVVLKLRGRSIVLDFSKMSVNFTALKVLRLDNIMFEDDESSAIIFANSPVLEDVFVHGVTIGDPEEDSTLVIFSSSVKKLVVSDYGRQYAFNDLEINAPSLEYLCLGIILTESFEIKYMPYLVEAFIDTDPISSEATEACKEILEAVSNVKFLTLFGDTTKCLAEVYDLLDPKFVKLERLTVGFKDKDNEWKVIPKLIQYSSNLKQLNFT